MIIRGEWKYIRLHYYDIDSLMELIRPYIKNRVSTGRLDMLLFADSTLIVLIDDQLDIKRFFSIYKTTRQKKNSLCLRPFLESVNVAIQNGCRSLALDGLTIFNKYKLYICIINEVGINSTSMRSWKIATILVNYHGFSVVL